MHGYDKERVKIIDDSRQQSGKKVIRRRSVEMDNFQNPQVRKKIVGSFFFADILLFAFLKFSYPVHNLW